jgi:hypothetical protein
MFRSCGGEAHIKGPEWATRKSCCDEKLDIIPTDSPAIKLMSLNKGEAFVGSSVLRPANSAKGG